ASCPLCPAVRRELAPSSPDREKSREGPLRRAGPGALRTRSAAATQRIIAVLADGHARSTPRPEPGLPVDTLVARARTSRSVGSRGAGSRLLAADPRLARRTPAARRGRGE